MIFGFFFITGAPYSESAIRGIAETDTVRAVTSMLVTDVGDQMC